MGVGIHVPGVTVLQRKECEREIQRQRKAMEGEIQRNERERESARPRKAKRLY